MPKKRGKTARCAIYTRQSRTKSGVRVSLDLQRDICADFAKERSWQLEERFDDAGESSETLDRPALQMLLRKIEADQIDHVVVYTIDRLTRKLFDLHRLLDRFERNGVVLSVVTDPHFGETAAGRLMTNIVAAASEFQQEMTRERMAEARSSLKRKGRRVAGRVPYGYTTEPGTKQLVIQRREASRIHKMFKFAAEGIRPKEIAEIANKRRWRTSRNNGLWTARSVLKVLSNPTYVGLIRNGSGTLPGQHQAVVDKDLFEQVRRRIESRRSRKPGRQKSQHLWPLRGVLKCSRCGRAMIPSMSGYRNLRYRYYRCRSTAGGKPPCKNVCLPAFQIERVVRTIVFGGFGDDLTLEHREVADRLSKTWQNLDEWTQIKRLGEVVDEVVFDADQETVAVTMVDDLATQLCSQR